MRKIFFGILLITLGAYHLAVGLPRAWETIDLIADIAGVIAVFGYCWEIPIINRMVWKVFFPLFIIWHLFYRIFIPELQKIAEINPPQWYTNFDLIFSLTLILIWYLVVFLYGYKSSDIWG